MSLGALSVAMYGATACYAIKAPRIPGEGPAKGGIKLHKYLIYIHAPGMILLSMFSMLVLLAFVTAAPGQRMTVTPADPNLENGKAVWNGGCLACHGADGKGAPKSYTVFKRPDTWPDFTRCDQTTSEPDSAYKAVIVHGGRGLGFSQIMPAFGDLLTPTQVDDVIAYLRTFCQNDHHYPLGVLNLPRAIVTEKAFPEDELVISTAANISGPGSWTTDVIHEQTFAGRNQIEVDVPINYARLNAPSMDPLIQIMGIRH